MLSLWCRCTLHHSSAPHRLGALHSHDLCCLPLWNPLGALLWVRPVAGHPVFRPQRRHSYHVGQPGSADPHLLGNSCAVPLVFCQQMIHLKNLVLAVSTLLLLPNRHYMQPAITLIGLYQGATGEEPAI